MEQIVAIAHRRRCAVAVFLIIEILRRQQWNHHRRRLWSRQWLQRRSTHDSALTMLFNELG